MNQLFIPRLARVGEDLYLPIVNVESVQYMTVRIDYPIRGPDVYWQLVDPTFSLLELGFDSSCGRLVSCSIPLFNGDVRKHNVPLNSAGKAGTAFFEMTDWADNELAKMIPKPVLKSTGRIQLDQYADTLVITINPEKIESTIVSGNKLACSFGANRQLNSILLIGDRVPAL